jgi:hypothetical protein
MEATTRQQMNQARFRALFPALRSMVWLDTPGAPPGALRFDAGAVRPDYLAVHGCALQS